MRSFGPISYLFLADRVTESCFSAPKASVVPGFKPRYSLGRSVGSDITAFKRHPSVTESIERSRQIRGARLLSRFRLSDWIVPPVVVPLLLLLFAIAAVFLHG